jgi:predicted regulator of Ras-like GTPase activity (Roadblock/LC7/MglB family)
MGPIPITAQLPGWMNLSNIVLHETDHSRLRAILARTQRDLRADLVLLIDRGGHQIAWEGPAQNIDLTALSSLAAANIAATDGLAQVVGEADFSIIYHQGKNRNIHISDVARRFSLVLVFDDAVSLGMVRWKVKRATAALDDLFRMLLRKHEAKAGPTNASAGPVPPQFTDEEIDNLFGHFGSKPPLERKG